MFNVILIYRLSKKFHSTEKSTKSFFSVRLEVKNNYDIFILTDHSLINTINNKSWCVMFSVVAYFNIYLLKKQTNKQRKHLSGLGPTSGHK